MKSACLIILLSAAVCCGGCANLGREDLAANDNLRFRQQLRKFPDRDDRAQERSFDERMRQYKNQNDR